MQATRLVLLTAAPLASAAAYAAFFDHLGGHWHLSLTSRSRNSNANGPLRLFIPPLLATPLAFVITYYLEQSALNPQAELTTGIAIPPLALMFVLMAAPVPLHSAQPITANRTADCQRIGDIALSISAPALVAPGGWLLSRHS